MRKALIAVGGLALALSIGACGAKGDGKYTDANSLARAVSASTAKVKTSKMTMDMKMGPMVVTAQGAGSYDGANTKMAMTMSMDFGSLGAPAGLQKMDIEARMLDGTMYMKLPTDFPGATVDEAKPWFKLSAEDVMPGGGDMTKYLEQSDPTQIVELLKESGELTDTETNASVDGVAATKYTFDVDFKKMIENYGGSLDSIPGVGDLDLDSIPTEVWVDRKDLPVQVRIDFAEMMQELLDSLGGEDALPAGVNFDEAYVSMKFTEWGSPVEVEAPPAEEISEGTLPGLGG